MNVEELAEKIEQYVRERCGSVSFTELQQHFKGAVEVSGDYAIPVSNEYPNIFLWADMSEVLSDAVTLLKRQGRIEFRSTQVLVYLIDGCVLNMPVARQLRYYKKPRWIPVCIHPGETKRV